MSTIPPLSELELAAKETVWDAKMKNNLKKFTPRLVRATLEEKFKLVEGTLDAAMYKSAINAATKAALKEKPPTEEKKKRISLVKSSTPSKTKRRSDGTVKGEAEEESVMSAPNSKGKAKKALNGEEKDEKKQEGVAKKRRKIAQPDEKKVDEADQPSTSSSSRAKLRKGHKETSFKSAEYIPTSDVELDENPTKPESPSKEKSNGLSSPKNSVAPKQKSKDKGDLPADEADDKSESELSVLIDEPAERKHRKTSKTKEPKKPRAKKELPVLTKDEEKIKRLKSLVVTCGVRKVWSKVFQGLDTKQQITKLEEILSDLGMKGRMTQEQAKAIKETRELAKELEDVQAFAKSVEETKDSKERSRRSLKSLRKIESSGSEEEKEESNEDESSQESGVVPKKRTVSARKSIMAFLQDQSSEEE